MAAPLLTVCHFIGNLHKWMFCPRGCAVLYVRESLQESTVPLVASHFHYSSFGERFLIQGTRDSVPYCMAPTAIEFFNNIGGLVSFFSEMRTPLEYLQYYRIFIFLQSAISSYNTALLSWATDMLCQRLSLSPLPIPAEMCAPFMSVMLLPDCLGPATPENEKDLMERLFHKYNVQTVFCVIDKRLCLRCS